MTRALPGEYPLYFVTDHRLNAGRPKLEVIAAALRGGIKLVQYRDKELADAEFEAEAMAALELCRSHGATLLVNDRIGIARKIGADGVHLGQGDGTPQAAREFLGNGAVIGLSTHDEEEVKAAQNLPVDYINIGPIFPTGTKEHARTLGLEEVLRLSRLTRHRWTTLGGIGPGHLQALFSSGIKTAAMVTAISQAENVERQTAEILAGIRPFFAAE